MSKKKPGKVFRVITADCKELIVLARHPKGARSVASEAGHTVLPSKSNVVEVDQAHADQAINGVDHDHT